MIGDANAARSDLSPDPRAPHSQGYEYKWQMRNLRLRIDRQQLDFQGCPGCQMTSWQPRDGYNFMPETRSWPSEGASFCGNDETITLEIFGDCDPERCLERDVQADFWGLP